MSKLMCSDFLAEVDPSGRLRISACYQCGKCSAGCPMHFDTDMLPSQLIRLIQLGSRDEVLKSKHVWACASCGTCVSRCPMGVRTPEVIDHLRAIATHDKKASETKSGVFNDAFLGSVKRFGRVFEPAMLISYKLKTRDLFSDMDKGKVMFAKGKMKITPPKGADAQSVRRIFLKVTEKK